MMRVALITNPTAGRGLAADKVSPVLDAMRRRGIDARVFETARRGDARVIVRDAAAELDLIVVVGGDGTVHEVASGLYGCRATAAIAVVPAGSGNDFAKALRMPTRPEDAVAAIVSSSVTRCDLGRVRLTEVGGDVKDGVFVNAFGFGFDSMVAERAEGSRKLRGTIGYLSLALRTLTVWKPQQMNIRTQGWEFSGPSLLVTVGNGTCSGGGFYLTPHASIDDGELDLCHIAAISLPRLLLLLPRVLWGAHTGHPSVTYLKTSSTSIESANPLPVHLDGEILSNKALRIEVQVLPGALHVRAPF